MLGNLLSHGIIGYLLPVHAKWNFDGVDRWQTICLVLDKHFKTKLLNAKLQAGRTFLVTLNDTLETHGAEMSKCLA